MTPYEVLRQAKPRDAMVRWSVDPSSVISAVCEGEQIGWLRVDAKGQRWVTVLGHDADTVNEIVKDLAHDNSDQIDQIDKIDGLTCQANIWPQIWATWPGRNTGNDLDYGYWALWYQLIPRERSTRAVRTADTNSAVVLDPVDPRIRPLLAHSSSAHVFPGDPRLLRWVGVEVGTHLISVAGQIRAHHGATEIVSVCTEPRYRGHGYAALCVESVVDFAILDGYEAVILEAYAENAAAAAVYSRAGFTEHDRYCSWMVTQRPG